MSSYVFSHLFLTSALTIAIALVWLINGLLCKVMNQVPRHQLIVACILGNSHAGLFTKIIGVLEIGMAAWTISGIKPELCAVVQIVVVAVMNIVEFIAVPQLLLFGRINILVAFFFITVVYGNAFILPHFIHP